MNCVYCACEPVPESFASPRDCAFKDGIFKGENWNCVTMNRLRDLCENSAHWSEDESIGIISNDGRFIVLSWYKRRGRTQNAVVCSYGTFEPLTEEIALEFIKELC